MSEQMTGDERLRLAFERIAREFDRVDTDLQALSDRGALPEEMTLEWIMFQMWETFKNKEHCCGGEGGATSIEIHQEQQAQEQLNALDKLVAENQVHLVETDQAAVETELSQETLDLLAQYEALNSAAEEEVEEEIPGLEEGPDV